MMAVRCVAAAWLIAVHCLVVHDECYEMSVTCPITPVWFTKVVFFFCSDTVYETTYIGCLWPFTLHSPA